MKKLLVFSIAILALASCKKDDDEIIAPPEVNEEEVITKLELTFTDVDSGNEYTWTRSDPDGDGGNDPIFSLDTLPANNAMLMSVRIFNETEDPVEEMTGEIEEEDDEHQFFFILNEGANLSIIYNDSDGDGNPIGLNNDIQTGDPENVSLTVILRHQPDKDGDGVADGIIDNAGGDTDIEVTFNGVVQ